MLGREYPIFVKTSLCTFFAAGTCAKKTKCRFAHGPNELRAKPDLNRTKLCQDQLMTGRCSKGAGCKFAHNHKERRALNRQLCDVPQTRTDGNCTLEQNGFQFIGEELPCSWFKTHSTDVKFTSVPQASSVGSLSEGCEVSTVSELSDTFRSGSSAKDTPTSSFSMVGAMEMDTDGYVNLGVDGAENVCLWQAVVDGSQAYNTVSMNPLEQSQDWPNRKMKFGDGVSKSELLSSFPGLVLDIKKPCHSWQPNACSKAFMVHTLTGLKYRVQNSFLSFEDSEPNIGIRRSFSEGSL